jgi:hypothetical protein
VEGRVPSWSEGEQQLSDDERLLRSAVLRMQVVHGCTVFRTHDPTETAGLLMQLLDKLQAYSAEKGDLPRQSVGTAAAADPPLPLSASAAYCGTVKVKKCDNRIAGSRSLAVLQLCCTHRVSAAVAEAVLVEFGATTIGDLVLALHRIREEQGGGSGGLEERIACIVVGGKGRRLGPALCKSLLSGLFSLADP